MLLRGEQTTLHLTQLLFDLVARSLHLIELLFELPLLLRLDAFDVLSPAFNHRLEVRLLLGELNIVILL